MKVKSFRSNEIGLQFKVWTTTFDRVTHRLYLLGSLQELGAWAIEKGLEAFPTNDLHIWSVQVAIPPNSRFEWVWLKINVKTRKINWERPVKRNRSVGCFSGVLHSVWGEHEEVFLQSAAHVEVSTFNKTEDGQIMAITGSAATLGNWDMRHAVMANEFPNKSGYWKASFAFDAFTHLDFKWAVVKYNARQKVLSMERLPHRLFGRNTWMKVAAPWMSTSTVVVDTLPLAEQLDNKNGRTDILVRYRMRKLFEIRNWMVKTKDTRALHQSPSRIGRSQGSSHDLALVEALKALTNQDYGDAQSTVQLHGDFRSSPQVFALKGVGQTQMPTDFVNSDFSNQVPLADSGMVLQTVHTAAGDTAQYHLDADTAISLAQTQGVKRSEVLPSRSNIDTTNFYPLQAKRGPDMLKMAYEGLERKFDEFALTKPDNESLGGETLFEPAVDRVTPSVPMTWPMLSEIDAEQARKRAPQESKPKKKTKRSPKRVKIRQPWKMDEPKSGAPKLDISHLQKDQKDILAEAAAASQNFVSQARSAVTTRPSSTAPAKLGRDDTSKSYQDLTEEKTNIKEWERTRSASMASLVSKSSKSSRPSLQDQESQEPGPSDQGSED